MQNHAAVLVALGVTSLALFDGGLLARTIHAQTAPAPTRASGRGFTVAVPSGFSAVKDDRFKQVFDAGGLVLVAAERATTAPGGAQGFRASIVIAPIPAPLQGDLGASALCDQLADGAAANGSRTVKSRKIIPASWGPACQFEIVAKDEPNRGGVGTLAYRGTAGWMVTCNLDPRDGRARAACNEVLGSWRFEK